MSEPNVEYNYPKFTRAAVLPLLQWDNAPPIGQKAPDFPLATLDGKKTRLSELWASHTYTIVEFGSFT